MHPFCAARPLSPPCLLYLFPLPQSSPCFLFSSPHPSLPKPLCPHQRTASLPPAPLPCVVPPTASLLLEGQTLFLSPFLLPLFSLSSPSLLPLFSLSSPSLLPLFSLSPPSLLPLFSLSSPSLHTLPPLPDCPNTPPPTSLHPIPYSPPLFNAALQLAAQGPSSNPHPLRCFSYRELQQAAGYWATRSSSNPPPLRRFSYHELQQAAGGVLQRADPAAGEGKGLTLSLSSPSRLQLGKARALPSPSLLPPGCSWGRQGPYPLPLFSLPAAAGEGKGLTLSLSSPSRLQLGKARALPSPSLLPPGCSSGAMAFLRPASSAALLLPRATAGSGVLQRVFAAGRSHLFPHTTQPSFPPLLCHPSAHGQPSSGPPPLRRFSYRELQQAAGYFNASLQLGKGSFGTIFRGQVDEWLGELPRGSKREVAVKVLHTESVKAFDDCLVREGGDRRGEEGSMGLGRGVGGGVEDEREWSDGRGGMEEVVVKVLHAESVKAFDDCVILVLGNLRHPNLVQLLGYCMEDCSAALLSLTPPFLFLSSPTRIPIPLPLPPPQAEILVLGDLRHPNLVQLLGYCMEDSRAILVYELVERGDLHHWLHPNSDPCLTWEQRVHVAVGMAEGMAYLHGQNIIHRDFKSHNVMLDHELRAKVTDFGMATRGPEEGKTHVSTRIMGTLGYLDPDYIYTGHLTLLSDVFSLGVVLLELLTCSRSPFFSPPPVRHRPSRPPHPAERCLLSGRGHLTPLSDVFSLGVVLLELLTCSRSPFFSPPPVRHRPSRPPHPAERCLLSGRGSPRAAHLLPLPLFLTLSCASPPLQATSPPLSDVFSLGVVLLELLTGQFPTTAATHNRLFFPSTTHTHPIPPPLSWPPHPPNQCLLPGRCHLTLLSNVFYLGVVLLTHSHFPSLSPSPMHRQPPGHLTPLSDVFSLGVVLLELLTGRSPATTATHNRLFPWIHKQLARGRKGGGGGDSASAAAAAAEAGGAGNEGQQQQQQGQQQEGRKADGFHISQVVDPRLKGQFSAGAAKKLLLVALQCSQEEPSKRPDMNHVVERLREIAASGVGKGGARRVEGGGAGVQGMAGGVAVVAAVGRLREIAAAGGAQRVEGGGTEGAGVEGVAVAGVGV
ncbi:unnamed protein product [Closterium sp. NIES-65]|nr:unnamed protein product [Closterium sp. NIES-65]